MENESTQSASPEQAITQPSPKPDVPKPQRPPSLPRVNAVLFAEINWLSEIVSTARLTQAEHARARGCLVGAVQELERLTGYIWPD